MFLYSYIIILSLINSKLNDFLQLLINYIDFLQHLCYYLLKGGEKMPIHDPLTSVKYAHIKTTDEIETVISEIKKNAKNITDKKLSLTLLSDVFFKNERGDIYASYMSERLIIPPHNHDYYELNLVLSGKCVEIIGDNIMVLEEGDILFMPPSAVHATGIVGDSIGINLLFKPNFVTGAEKKLALSDKENYLSTILGQKSYMVFRTKNSSCSENAKKLADLFFNKDVFPTHYEIYAEAIALLILIELCHVEREDYLLELPKATHSVDTADAILGYIRDNIGIANLENTARHFGYSPVHLSRIIKKHTGSSFAKFILLQRMVAAEHLLSKTDMPIREIAASTGLESPEYFSRIFKKYNDVSPMQYRKEHR